MTTLRGDRVVLRPPTDDDIPRLATIRAHPDVYRFWRGGDDLVAAVTEDIADEETVGFAIERDGFVVGWVQYGEETDPDYASAGVDIYVDPAAQRQGIASDALRTLARHLFDDRGHHRLQIDPAAHNDAAIACYESVGFRRVGVLQAYERSPDGGWHDGLLMDMLRDQLR